MNTKSGAYLLIFLILEFIYSCHSDKKEISIGGYFMRGKINISNGDTILDGPIEYLNKNKDLRTLITYSHNKKDGRYLDYYPNGSLRQTANYSNDKENGFIRYFDSTGKLYYESNYYYGIEVGSIFSLKNGKPEKFRFLNFEGIELYRCEFNSTNPPLESGDLLNYVTQYNSNEDSLKLSIFLYLVNPPHKHLTYRLYDKNLLSSDSAIIYEIKSDSSIFKKILIGPPKQNHLYLWDVEAYYPNNQIRLHNVISEKERKLNLPGRKLDN